MKPNNKNDKHVNTNDENGRQQIRTWLILFYKIKNIHYLLYIIIIYYLLYIYPVKKIRTATSQGPLYVLILFATKLSSAVSRLGYYENVHIFSIEKDFRWPRCSECRELFLGIK